MSRSFTDTAMESLVSRTLRAGVYVSSFLMLAGFIVSLFHPEVLSESHPHPSLNQFLILVNPDREFFTRILDPFLLFYLGIIVLLLTPVIRVLIAIISFSLEKDSQFILISISVLLVLLFSFYLSFA